VLAFLISVCAAAEGTGGLSSATALEEGSARRIETPNSHKAEFVNLIEILLLF
jgi:hypothetical protein